ncbi:MAG: amidohydrolase family protein [Muribaculaceae bacterium]|nr:amidohydrolase family protein [Muribaculaceae bacterium]
MKRTLIYNGRFADMPAWAEADAWVLIEGERIAATGRGRLPGAPGAAREDARGALILPGMIDTHVHFREPGLTHKATIASESRAAVLGGVTSYLEMPNTKPATTSMAALEEKKEIAARDSAANYGFFLGASAKNIDEIRNLDPREVPGVKLFIGSSTGNMAVNAQNDLEAIFSASRVPIMVHAEDDAIIGENTLKMRERYGEDIPVQGHPSIRSEEACVAATRRAMDLARKTGARLHIAHVSTAAELAETEGAERTTLEVTPLHLTFCSDDYGRSGARIKVNPAVKGRADRDALRAAVAAGRFTTIGSDHAPHLPEEKEGGALKAASGAPSVQFALPLLLSEFPAETVVELYSTGPARLFDIEGRGSLEAGNYADVAVVERAEYTLTDADVASACGWTPFAGMTLRYRVRDVWVNGTRTVRDGALTGETHARALRFDRGNKTKF